MSAYEPESEAPPAALIAKTANMLPVPQGEPPEKRRRGFWRTVAGIWYSIKGYAAEDIDRLKEGGIQQIEGKGQAAIAEAQAKVAEAAERHANAEKLRAEGRKADAEAYAIKRKADGEYLVSAAEAAERVATAISTIKQAGGNVGFDKSEIKELLRLGQAEVPKDRLIQEAAEDASDTL